MLPAASNGPPPPGSPVGARVLPRPLRRFLAVQPRGALPTLAATGLALGWANSPWSASYEAVWSTELAVELSDGAHSLREVRRSVRGWVNEAALALLLFVLGLAASRDVALWPLRTPGVGIAVVAGVVGGLAAAGGLYLVVNPVAPAAAGWSVVAVTDLVLASWVLTRAGSRCPPQLRALLLPLVVVGNGVVLAAAALRAAERVVPVGLLVSVGLLGMLGILRRLPRGQGGAYLVVGVTFWAAIAWWRVPAGVAALLAGLALLAAPSLLARLRSLRLWLGAVRRGGQPRPSPAGGATAAAWLAERLHHAWVRVAAPAAALANAGVVVDHELVGRAVGSPVTLGIVAGLLVGRPVGLAGRGRWQPAGWSGPRRRWGRRGWLGWRWLGGLGSLPRCWRPSWPSPTRCCWRKPSSGSWWAPSARPCWAGCCCACHRQARPDQRRRSPHRRPMAAPTARERRMRARDLATPYPTLRLDAPAAEAAGLLAREQVEAVFVREPAGGRLLGIVTDLTLLGALLPRYLEEDQALTGVLEEAAADVLWQRLEGRSVGDLLRGRRVEVPQVDAECTLIEVAVAMRRANAPVVAVQRAGELLGGISSSRLLTRLLTRP
jgi:Na+/H+ antiporter NhaA/CBS domain-containing protein